jgi:hypothetical protein
MNSDPLELCRTLEETADGLDKTAATESNLEQIKNATAYGFRAIAQSIRDNYRTQVEDTKAPAPQTVAFHVPAQTLAPGQEIQLGDAVEVQADQPETKSEAAPQENAQAASA